MQQLPRVSVSHGSGATLAVPEVGKIVTARVSDSNVNVLLDDCRVKVTTVNPRLAKVDILCMDGLPLDHVFHGVVR